MHQILPLRCIIDSKRIEKELKLEYFGYAGKILHVDLTSHKTTTEFLDHAMIKQHLGGIGINQRLAYDLFIADTDPFSSDNPIIIGVGPLCGTLAPASGKVFATTKLPVRASKREKKYVVATATGGSTRFGAMIKNAGYDHIIITGKADKPSYLKIINDDVEICDAGDLWGKQDVYESSDELANRHRGKTGKAGTWVIGRAGENQLTASLGCVDGTHTMGRSGGAAMLGIKNLKAVVVLGSKGVKVADPKRFMALIDQKIKAIISHPGYGMPHHSATTLEDFNVCGVSFGKSFYSGDVFDKTKFTAHACSACLSACKSFHKIKEGRFTDSIVRAPIQMIYEAEKGSRLMLSHHGDAMKLMELIHRYGMCMFSVVRMLNFVTRLYERGVLSVEDTGGIELKTGDIDSYIHLLEKWVNRDDIGEYMAQGWFALSEKTGIDPSTDFADGVPIVRGSDVLHDIRWGTYGPGWFLAQVVRPRPIQVHQRVTGAAGNDIHRALNEVKVDFTEKMGLSEEEVNEIVFENDFNTGGVLKYAEDTESACNALSVCFGGGPGDPGRDLPWLSEIYSAATGFNITTKELRNMGEKIRNMEALLNAREGIAGEYYEPPALWLEHTIKPLHVNNRDYYATDWFGKRIKKDDMYKWMRDYYTARGWDIELRIPTYEKLEELGLEEFNHILEPYFI
jgi:aldehyde:ferredoxin oxidoreductase